MIDHGPVHFRYQPLVSQDSKGQFTQEARVECSGIKDSYFVYTSIPLLAQLLVPISEMYAGISTVITECLLHPVDFACQQASLTLE